jgi:hypothetical protein
MQLANVFQAVVPDVIWSAERPVWFGGVRLRARTTVVRLSDGGLWVHSPVAPTDEVCAALDALGEVRWIVVPNRFHHLHAPATAARYPDAQVVAPASVRNPRVTATVRIDDPSLGSSVPELAPVPLAGVPFLDETAFFHRPSGSLIAADLLMCACARDHWTWRFVARVSDRYEKVRTPPDVRMHVRPSQPLNESLERMQALPIEQILVAHADPITDRPVQQLAEAWRFATSKTLSRGAP